MDLELVASSPLVNYKCRELFSYWWTLQCIASILGKTCCSFIPIRLSKYSLKRKLTQRLSIWPPSCFMLNHSVRNNILIFRKQSPQENKIIGHFTGNCMRSFFQLQAKSFIAHYLAQTLSNNHFFTKRRKEKKNEKDVTNKQTITLYTS